MLLLKILVIAIIVAGVVLLNWNRADAHSVDEPSRRVGVWIVTIFGTLFTLLWLFDHLGFRWWLFR
jgi:hypothetical protein